ncbi:MAG: PspA/IM30 family protein [Oscillospiraceae bacterium]|nr:PspA/IM30 family protein [Oscillospiraceae bacterium]
MGFFSRISDIFKSNINELIDHVENPEKMEKQIILNMQEELNQSMQALGNAVANERIAEKQYQEAVGKSAEREKLAKVALVFDNIYIAKKMLQEKLEYDQEAENYKKIYDAFSGQTVEIKTQVETLKAKLAEIKTHQAMLMTRSQMAETKKNLAQAVRSADTASSCEKFNHMEEQVIQKEAEADVLAEMAGIAVSKESKLLEQLQTDVKVDTELQRLMAEMGQFKPEKNGLFLEEQIATVNIAEKNAVAESME